MRARRCCTHAPKGQSAGFPAAAAAAAGAEAEAKVGDEPAGQGMEGKKSWGFFFLENIQGQNFSRRGGARAIARTPQQLVWRGATRVASDA